MNNNIILQVENFLSPVNPDLWLQLRLEKTIVKN